jgi:hypothetical protein
MAFTKRWWETIREIRFEKALQQGEKERIERNNNLFSSSSIYSIYMANFIYLHMNGSAS